MFRLPRRALAGPVYVLTGALALAAGGCAAPGGLDAGEPAPPVAAQPSPDPLWPAWSETSPTSPGAPAATREAPPLPLKGAPEIPAGGFGDDGVDVLDVVRADQRMKPYAAQGWIQAPGRAGLRPPVYQDLTGDGHPELIVAADTESGRTVLAAYTAREGKVYPILLTAGARMAVEALGRDLVVRTAAQDSVEHAVRYRWDGDRMTVVQDEKRYRKPAPGKDHDEKPVAPGVPPSIPPPGPSGAGTAPPAGTAPSAGAAPSGTAGTQPPAGARPPAAPSATPRPPVGAPR
ncbi:hypothetical protein [Streptomyces sp. NPDC090022]|uniref:hypothetical protein n=1 Tax=Streptomyces sp. NPDC090022 TaxID=3365920 RepID=UPI003810C905